MEEVIYKYLPFEYDELSTRRAKVYLEQQALLGYEFISCKGIRGTLGWAKFKINEPKKITYRIEIIDKRVNTADKSMYQELGWELVGQVGSIKILKWQREGEEVAEDLDLELEKKKALAVNRNNQLGLIVLLPILLLMSNSYFEWNYEILLSNLQLFNFLTKPLFAGILLHELLRRSFYKKKMEEEIKSEMITVSAMRKSVISRRMFWIIFAVLFSFSLITETLVGNGFVIIGTIVVIGGIGGLLGYKLTKITKIQDKVVRRRRMISVSLLGLVATMSIPIILFPLIGIRIGSAERRRTDMSKYPVLSIGTLENLDKEAYRTQMFHKSTSVLVPRGYEYREYLKDGRMVKSDYYQTTYSKIAQIIYDGKIEEHEESIEKYGDNISSRLKHIEGSCYDEREVIYDEKENILFIRDDKKILVLEGDIDFEEEKYKEVVEGILED